MSNFVMNFHTKFLCLGPKNALKSDVTTSSIFSSRVKGHFPKTQLDPQIEHVNVPTKWTTILFILFNLMATWSQTPVHLTAVAKMYLCTLLDFKCSFFCFWSRKPFACQNLMHASKSSPLESVLKSWKTCFQTELTQSKW